LFMYVDRKDMRNVRLKALRTVPLIYVYR